jgi:predicted enzyme related to lactoylglutathione lyase
MAHQIENHARKYVVGFLLVFSLLMYSEIHAQTNDSRPGIGQEDGMQIRFLEIVTPELEQTCKALEAVHGVSFGEPVPMLGNARTASLAGGGVISVRAPMRETEAPVVRPYVLVDDIKAAVKEAEAKGAMIAHPPMEIPGQGTFAIYILGGIEHGLWED